MGIIRGKDFKVKINNEDVNLYFRRPTQSELFEMDLEFRRIFSHALRQDIMTEAEAKKSFQKSGAWTNQDEKQMANYTRAISMLELDLEKEDKTKEEKMKVVEELSDLRVKFLDLVGTRTELFSNTAEGLANEQRMHKFIELCCTKKNGERFFSSKDVYEQFAIDNADELADIYRQATLFEYSLPDDITQEWGEYKYLRKVSEEEEKEKQEKEKKKLEKKKKGKKKTKKKKVKQENKEQVK